MTQGYQPKPRILANVCGYDLDRPAPTNPKSLRCKCGFHDYKHFSLPAELREKALNVAMYCTRCNKVHGLLVPRRPTSAPPRHPSADKISGDTITADRIIGEEVKAITNSPVSPTLSRQIDELQEQGEAFLASLQLIKDEGVRQLDCPPSELRMASDLKFDSDLPSGRTTRMNVEVINRLLHGHNVLILAETDEMARDIHHRVVTYLRVMGIPVHLEGRVASFKLMDIRRTEVQLAYSSREGELRAVKLLNGRPNVDTFYDYSRPVKPSRPKTRMVHEDIGRRQPPKEPTPPEARVIKEGRP